jgi:hypothetical protein
MITIRIGLDENIATKAHHAQVIEGKRMIMYRNTYDTIDETC